MAKNVYKTAQGQLVDMDNLRLVNESVIAVGNMGVNARGDRVSPNGEIIETRNEIMKKRYNTGTTLITNPFKGQEQVSVDTQPKITGIEPETTVQLDTEVATQEPTVPTLRGSLANSLTESLADYTVFDSATDIKTVDKDALPKLKRI